MNLINDRWANSKIAEIFNKVQIELNGEIEKLIQEYNVEKDRPLELAAAIELLWSEAHKIEQALELADNPYKQARYKAEREETLALIAAFNSKEPEAK